MYKLTLGGTIGNGNGTGPTKNGNGGRETPPCSLDRRTNRLAVVGSDGTDRLAQGHD